MKKSAKVLRNPLSAPVWETHKMHSSRIFGETGLAEKMAVCAVCEVCAHNPPAEEVGWLRVFLYEAFQNFELWLNIQDQN
jgi:hypothetical protein